MKYYVLEPTHKKSVFEYQQFRKTISQNGEKLVVVATLETCWRWGSWLITVPETDEELDEYCKLNDVSIEDWPNGYDDLREQLTPNPLDEYHDLDDYDAEMIETWDGVSEDWSINTLGNSDIESALTAVLDTELILDEITETWYENYIEGLEELGFEESGFSTEIGTTITLKNCTSDGTLIH